MPATVPYQVKLFSGQLIYVPSDLDQLCRKLEPVWWETFFSAGKDLTQVNSALELESLLKKGKNPNERDLTNETLLLTCTRRKWLAGVEAALRAGADPNLGDDTCNRPLHIAVLVGQEMVQTLLAGKADPNLQNKDPEQDPDFTSKTLEAREWHRTPLHFAATESAEICEMLLDHNADPNILDGQYYQALHLAIEEDQEDVIDVLLARGADVNTGNSTIGLTSSPLIDAAFRNNLALARKLIAARADLNRTGKQGMTALHMAARGKHTAMASLLLASGADPAKETSFGKNAAELAEANKAEDLAAMIREVTVLSI